MSNDHSEASTKSNAAPDIPSRRDMLRTWVLLARAHAKFVHRMHQVFSSHGLTGPQFDVMATLHRTEGITQQELAAGLLVTKGNVTGVIDRMEAVAWIERRPDPEDRRANRLYLTVNGRKKFSEVVPEHHALLYEVMAGFAPVELNTFCRLLRQFEEGIEK